MRRVVKTSINTLPALIEKLHREPFSITTARSIFLHPSLPPNEAKNVLQYIRGQNHQSPNLYKYYLTGVARRGDRKELERAIEHVTKRGVSSQFGEWRDVYLQLHAVRNEVDPLFAIFSSAMVENKMHLINVHDFLFCLRVTGRSSKSVLEMFEVVWREMKASGTKPDVRVMNTFIQHYEALGEYGKLEKHLSEEGVQANAYTYHQLIIETTKKAVPDQVKEKRVGKWLERMKKDAVMPELMTYNFLLDWRAKKGDLVGAQNWMKEMQAVGLEPDVVTYTSLIDATARHGEMEAVEKWMGEMREKGLKPNIITFNCLVDAAGKKGDKEMAEKWMEEMKKEGLRPDAATYSSLMNRKKGDEENKKDSQHWLEEMKTKGVKPTISIFNNLLLQATKDKDRNREMRLLEEMRKAKLAPDVVTFACLVSEAIKRGKNDTVKFWYDKMQQRGVPVVSMRKTLAQMLGAANDTKGLTHWMGE